MSDVIQSTEPAEPTPIAFIDLSYRNTEGGYVDSIALLCFNIRSLVLTCDGCSQTMLKQAEADILTIKETPEDERLETCASILQEWETRAEENGLIGWAEEGFYYVAWRDS